MTQQTDQNIGPGDAPAPPSKLVSALFIAAVVAGAGAIIYTLVSAAGF